VVELDFNQGEAQISGETNESRTSSNVSQLEIYAEKLLLLQQIQKCSKITAWDIFVIKKSLALSFLGAVIPFCHMSFQLTQKSNDVIAYPNLNLNFNSS
jgi:hypothetical protein